MIQFIIEAYAAISAVATFAFIVLSLASKRLESEGLEPVEALETVIGPILFGRP